MDRRYFLQTLPVGLAALTACASGALSGRSSESSTLTLFNLAKEYSSEIRQSSSSDTAIYVARYIDRANYDQKKNAGMPLTHQDIYVTVEAALSHETGAPVSLRIDAGHNGRLFDAGVDGMHHQLEEGYALPVNGAGDSLWIPQDGGKNHAQFNSDNPQDLESVLNAQRVAGRFIQDTLNVIQKGGIVPTKSRDFK